MKPARRDAYRLLHEGSLALARVEENGIRIDMDLLDKTIEKVERRVDELTNRLERSEEWEEWTSIFGRKASLGSRIQLSEVLEKMGHELIEKTKGKKRKSMAKGTLERLDDPFVRSFLEIEKLKKLNGTYLKGVKREVLDGVLRPSFWLHTVKTYRGSSSNPNFQNVPIRDKVIGKLIRSCFVPRDGHVLVEVDFKQLEVRVAACYSRDPVLMEYIETGYDFHREFAAQCYMLDQSEVSEDVRYCGKNRFVFPEIYGSYFMLCAPSLWRAIDEMKLETDGVSLRDHLASKGIHELGRVQSKWGTGRSDDENGWIDTDGGSFVDHIRNVEQELWERFNVHAQWKLNWYARYLKRGRFDLLTGFRETGIYKRNDVTNHPIQGASFHCLLWCLIELMKRMKKSKMRSKVVGQIHDSILADVRLSELDDYVAMVRRLMTLDIRKAWSWIVVPLAVDVSVGENNWFEMKEMVV